MDSFESVNTQRRTVDQVSIEYRLSIDQDVDQVLIESRVSTESIDTTVFEYVTLRYCMHVDTFSTHDSTNVHANESNSGQHGVIY